MHALSDHSGSPAVGESALDRWDALWEPAARRYQPVVEQSPPAAHPAASTPLDAAAQP
ncbi:hypothetical protein [Paenarthrobacter nitroguajacolicus]|uniref:hypothetical protein n=1 Tax=Paenarthrobacter nitroguajacolicus TaxID=211146 RepID=UPI004054639B